MSQDAVTHTLVDPQRMADVFNETVNVLSRSGYSRQEAVAGLLIVIGTQYNSSPLGSDMMLSFVKDATDWMTCYFGVTEGTTH